jgi:phosphate ABC transporter phosphate-binding protein
MLALAFGPLAVSPVAANTYVPISGAGSTWSQNALDQWIADVNQYGMQVNYAGTGSSDGRSEFLAGTVDFAASDIPFQSDPTDGSAPENPAPGSYAYIPITAGGTSLMYNLTINGQRVTNLRLSGENIAKIFTGEITNWSDPAIAADNPQLTLPNESIVPVVRSDGSGSSFQFSAWMIAEYPSEWTSLCNASGRAPECGPSSYWPTTGNMIAQNGDLGVAGYVAQSYAEGAIGYVNYSYALNAKFPVAQMLNVAGYYTEPTPDNVAVSLLQAQVDTTDTNPSLYLTQKLGNVYTDTDPRTYPLSSYSYLILPTTVQGQFSTAKGNTLGAFTYYAMCQGQQESASLGYSPMPYNLVEDTFSQIAKIPGEQVPANELQPSGISLCNNPTIDPSNPSDPNALATTAPEPAACAKQGPIQCATGTAGDTTPTPLNGGSSSSGSSSSGSSSSGASPTGSSSTGSSSSGASSSGSPSSGSPSGASPSGNAASSSGGATASSSASTPGTGTSAATATTLVRRVVNGKVVTEVEPVNRSATGSSAATGSATGATGSAGSSACDPSTGACSVANDQSSDGYSLGSSSGNDPTGTASEIATTDTTVATSKGWTGTQTLMVFIAFLFLGLVLAPGIASRMLARRDE